MKRSALIIVAIFVCMSLQPVIATSVAPNDSETVTGSVNVLSVDGFVTTKFASVGSEVDIQAYTRGHSSNTYVSADIVKYNIDPLDSMINTAFPGAGAFVDRVVLTSVGAHEDDANTMVWQGTYTVPVSSMGGVYGARIIAEDGNLRAIDDSTQLRELFRAEAEKVLQAIDFAWDAANPTLLIKGEFDEVEQKATSHGGWSNFVATASEGSGIGGSQQLWDSMIDAGHNQYNMSAGANFLETMMVYLDSGDVNASLSFITGLLLYANNFPLPRTFYDFEEVFDYIQTFDPIENFTRLEGTTDFEAAYNSLLGSDEWDALEQAIENLANNQKPFESMQIIMHNIALLAVSNHPAAISEALMEWISPLVEGDFGNMTPLQQLIVRWVEMAEELEETDIQDTDGDEIPDIIMWQYEYLLQTTEGQAWTAKMQSSASWVNDAVDDFNTMPEDILGHIATSMEYSVWDDAGEAMEIFGDWIENASGVDRYMYWPDYEEEEEDDESPPPQDDSIVFRELYPVRTTLYDTHVLEIGIEMKMWGGDNQNYPESFSISMTNLRGETVNTNLMRDNMDMHKYVGILTTTGIEETEWSFSQPLENYDGENIENAELRMQSLRPSMMEVMLIYEGNDEIFMVSAAGVLVDQDETSLTGVPYTIDATTYDSAGEIQGADVDIAVIRISPQLGEEAVRSLEPEGEMEYTITYPDTLEGRYTGEDLDGDLSVRIMQFGEYHDDDNRRSSPQSYEFEEIELSGMGSLWDASNNLPSQRGVVEVVTSGTTVEGLEFEFMQQLPLPDSLGCTRTEGSFEGKHVNMGYHYRTFEADEGVRYYKPDLQSVEFDWGDGNSQDMVLSTDEDPSDWEGHDYVEDGEYVIKTTYVDENGNEVVVEFQYSTDEGFWIERDEYYDGWIGTGECWMERDDSSMPTPEIIDNFITGGPVEVVKEEILVSDSDGKVSLTINPQLPGIYISIVQSKITLPTGEVMTGIGVNFVAITDGSVSIGGLTEIATFAGLPVYSVEPDSSGLTTLTINPSGISQSEFTASLGIAPMDMDVPFPDIDWSDLSEMQGYDLEFQSGDTSRSQEVRFKAPISLVGVVIMPNEESMWPSAITMGIVLNNPAQLDLMGTLGPGQTTNIALDDADGEASRILAIAAPSVGFDLTSLDFASLTSLIYEQGIRPEVGWIAEETKSTQICERIDIWHEERYDEGNYSNVRIGIYQEHHNSEYYPSQTTPYPSNAVLEREDGTEIDTVHDWQTTEWDERYVAGFHIESNAEETYTISTGTAYSSEVTFNVYEEEGELRIDWMEENMRCSGQEEMTEEEIFSMFDEFIGDVNSIAWGIGSSADLKLPYLASPISNYTVLGIVQQGSGNSATITSAIGSQNAEANPEPLVMKNLTLDFMPDNPSAGDSLLITATDEETGAPVGDLSVVILNGGVTINNLNTNSNGQTSFILPEGELLIRVSGGMYNAAEFMITVTSDGTVIEEPLDTDGDGISDEFDTDDDNDGIPDTDDQCPDTPIGAIVDSDGCPSADLDSDGDGVMDDDDLCPNTPQGTTVESDGCEEEQVVEDADSDGVEDGTDLCPDTPTGEVTNSVGCSDSQLDDGEDDTTGMTTCEEWEYWNPDQIDESLPGNGCPDYVDDSASESSDEFFGMDMLTIGGIGGVIFALAIISLLYVRRGGSIGDNDWKYEEEEELFDSQNNPYESSAPVEEVAAAAPMQSGPPRAPPPGHQGHMSDGYEVTEYPEGSGSWWWKDPTIDSWKEWS